MNKYLARKYNIKNLIYWFILVYPVINIIVCYIFNGDNMNTLSLFVCFLIFISLAFRKGKISIRLFAYIFALIVVVLLSLIREKNYIAFTSSVVFAASILMMYVYSYRYSYKEKFQNFLLKHIRAFYIVQLVYVLILAYYVFRYGLYAGWSTYVLKGPYHYPHSLAYILVFLLFGDLFIYTQKKERIAIVLSVVNMSLIIITAVRSALLVAVISFVFVFKDLFNQKKFGRTFLYAFMALIILSSMYRYGIFDSVIRKTNQAIRHNSITNGRIQFLKTSFTALSSKNGAKPIDWLLGVGMSKLTKTNYRYWHQAIHAHNDFADALICYGIFGITIYGSSMAKFMKRNYIWLGLTVGLLAFSNGLFMYIDCIPILVYARMLFETNTKGVKNR